MSASMGGGAPGHGIRESIIFSGCQTTFGYIACKFFCSWSMWPFSIAMDCRGCWSLAKVNPTNSSRCPCWSASAKVERMGLNMAACAKATSSAGFSVPMAALANCLLGSWMSKCQSLVTGVQWPVKMLSPLCVMVTSVAVKVTLHLALHSWPMDNNGCVANCGKMCPWCTAGGNVGQLKSASWVEWIIAPEGLCMVMGLFAGCCCKQECCSRKMCYAAWVCNGIKWCVCKWEDQSVVAWQCLKWQSRCNLLG